MGCVDNTTPGRFTPGIDSVPIVEEAAGAPGSVWTGPENLTSTWPQFPNASDLIDLALPANTHKVLCAVAFDGISN